MTKRGFTLVEMLIVVALIATLMTIVFRLGSVGGKDNAANTTVIRMAKLENCLSGYYAAYGNYPAVRTHNSRDIYQKVDGHGVQSSYDENQNIWNWKKIGDQNEADAWEQVEAACRAQPVGAEFPFSDDATEDVENLLATLRQNLQSGKFKNYPKPGDARYNAVMAGFDGLNGKNSNLGRFGNKKSKDRWRDIQLFKFGLMSYLLPRYQMMMGASDELYEQFAQWNANNGAVSNPLTGEKYDSWGDFNDLARDDNPSDQDVAAMENVATDAVCARWLPNLAGICAGTSHSIVYYGVDICDSDSPTSYLLEPSEEEDSSFPNIHFYSPDGDSTSGQYILDSITVLDGWSNEFYYYSPSPYQSYQLWSSGANGRTFPPWFDRTKLNSEQNRCVSLWTMDDIKGMSR